MSSTYPTAFYALSDSVRSMIATTTPIEPLLSLGWSDEDIAELIARFPHGVGKPYVGSDQATVLGDLAQRRAEWQARKTSGNGHDHAAVHIDSCGTAEIIDIVPNLDAAKSAAWAFAQRTGATFVPTRRRVQP